MRFRHHHVVLGGLLPVLIVSTLHGGARAEDAARCSYVAYRFARDEGWWAGGAGDGGASRWTPAADPAKSARWELDFSAGARWLSLYVSDRTLPGKVEKIRLRARGGAKGHPVRLFLHTHFMTFHKVIGEFAEDGEQEIVTDGPPGPGWEWSGGENDGRLHGPIRLGEIRIEGGGVKDHPALDLSSVIVEASSASARRCILVAEKSGGGAAGSGDRQRFVAEVRAVSDVPLEGTLGWRFRTWDGVDLGTGEQRVTVPASAERLRIEVPGPAIPGNLRFLEVEFRLTIPGQDVPPAQAYWLGSLPAGGDSTPRPQSPFGMGLYLCRLGPDEMQRAAEKARQAGVKWSREDFSWGHIEPERGRFEWSFHDGLIACARRNGITVYAIVGYWTSWTKPYTLEGIQDYVAFLRELVKRYKGDIKQWEIWNEPNIFFWQGPKELYATLLEKSYAAIKETDPSAEVLGLSTAGIDYRFIEDMLARKAPFDILTIHPYRKELDDPVFIADLKKVSDLVRLPDGRRRPVWLTEMGWATHVPHNALEQDFVPNTQRAQAELIARSYLCAIVSGVEPRTFWYDFRNDGEDPVYFEHNMGIIHRDFRPKPAYIAYATLASVLRGKKLEGPVDVPGKVLAYRFVPEGRGRMAAVALWSPQADATVALQVKAGRVVIVNAVGERRAVRTGAAAAPGGSATVTVNLPKGAPVYVLARVGEAPR